MKAICNEWMPFRGVQMCKYSLHKCNPFFHKKHIDAIPYFNASSLGACRKSKFASYFLLLILKKGPSYDFFKIKPQMRKIEELYPTFMMSELSTRDH